jgi:hypothetical protein
MNLALLGRGIKIINCITVVLRPSNFIIISRIIFQQLDLNLIHQLIEPLNHFVCLITLHR